MDMLHECRDESSLSKTISSMMKVLMKREVATQFSLTGKSTKEDSKKVFKNTAAFRLIERKYLIIISSLNNMGGGVGCAF